MLLNTTRFGQIEIEEKEIINFPEGILGFEEFKRYCIIHQNSEEDILKWLQSVDNPALAFIIIRPVDFLFSYSVDIPEEDVKLLELKSPDDAQIYAIVTVPDDPSLMSANLQGPLVVNRRNRRGAQVIISDGKFKVKHYILQEMKERAKKLAEIQEKKEDTKPRMERLNTDAGSNP